MGVFRSGDFPCVDGAFDAVDDWSSEVVAGEVELNIVFKFRWDVSDFVQVVRLFGEQRDRVVLVR